MGEVWVAQHPGYHPSRKHTKAAPAQLVGTCGRVLLEPVGSQFIAGLFLSFPPSVREDLDLRGQRYLQLLLALGSSAHWLAPTAL